MTPRRTHHTMIAVLVLATSACGGAAAAGSVETLPPLIAAESAVAPAVSALPVVLAVAADDRIRLVADTLNVDGYEVLWTAWAESDVWQHIADQGVTVLAPSDRAFQHLPQDMVQNMLEHRDEVDALLTRHVLVGVYRYDQLAQLESVTNLAGQSLPIRVGRDGVVYIDEAPVRMPLNSTVTGADGQQVAVFDYGKILFDLG